MALQHPHYVVDSAIDPVIYTGFLKKQVKLFLWAFDFEHKQISKKIRRLQICVGYITPLTVWFQTILHHF